MTPSKIQKQTDAISPPKHADSAWAHRPFWEQCERRLALSAMPWMPLGIGPHETTCNSFEYDSFHSNDLLTNPAFAQPLDSNVSPPIEQHLSEAHSQTGWNQVHSQFGLTGKGQTVAVIDSGIAFDHVALGKGYGPGYKVSEAGTLQRTMRVRMTTPQRAFTEHMSQESLGLTMEFI